MEALVQHLAGSKSQSVLKFCNALLASNLNGDAWSLNSEDQVPVPTRLPMPLPLFVPLPVPFGLALPLPVPLPLPLALLQRHNVAQLS